MPASNPIHPDEHRRHLDHAAYQAAIERAAIQESGESTQEIEERTVGRDKGGINQEKAGVD